ncbi:MAG: hypothetical protein LBK58_02740 [Prevotellaceae bacterium]|jgi:hypothetical protein|nr:hypothetical protein [Prevotellaceae bacterium]
MRYKKHLRTADFTPKLAGRNLRMAGFFPQITGKNLRMADSFSQFAGKNLRMAADISGGYSCESTVFKLLIYNYGKI